MYNQGMYICEVAKLCNTTTDVIRYWENKYNVKLKRYDGSRKRENNFNEMFFNEIDNEEKSYLLGFIFADAGINSNNRSLDIKVHYKDIDILYKFNKYLNSNAKIYNNKNEKFKTIYLCSKKLVNSLSKYGIIKNKTKTIPFPNFNSLELYKHFLRGYFDGDGHIGKRQCALVIGSKEFFSGFMDFLNNKFNFVPWYTFKDSYYQIQFNRRDFWFINWLYSDSKIYLDRKYNAYLKYWSTYNPETTKFTNRGNDTYKLVNIT